MTTIRHRIFLTAAVFFVAVTGASGQSSGAAYLSRGDLQPHDIQGAGHISPYNRERVDNLVAQVTATTLRGFYVESVDPDDNPATSEGLFAETIRTPEVAPGDVVRLSGRIAEEYPGGQSSGYLSITKILRPQVEVIARDVALREPTRLGPAGRMPPTEVISDDSNGNVEESPFDPQNDGIDFYESLEGMRVSIHEAVSVGVVHTAYAEIFVLADRGRGASERTPRDGIVVREGDFNPERILIDYREEFPPYIENGTPRVAVGDVFTEPIIGVVGYSYGNYKVLPLDRLPRVIPRRLERERVAPASDPSILSVAAFNVYNLGGQNEAAHFADIAETIVDGLASPDIIALSEIQDSDGAGRSSRTDADVTERRLLAAIGAAGGPGDYRYFDIDPVSNEDGGAPNANIRVAFLYRSGRVEAGDAERVAPNDRAFVGARKPLAMEFVFRGERLVVIANHFSSKGGDGALYGRSQPPVLGSEPQRILQAEAVASYAARVLADDPAAHVIVAGDLNDFVFSPPLRVLTGSGLVNLAEALLPDEEIYSYIYEGNSQVLDHILVSPALFEATNPTVDYVHRYSEYLFQDRWSDHDPVLARFELE